MNVLMIKEVIVQSMGSDIYSVIKSMYYDSIVDDTVLNPATILGIKTSTRKPKVDRSNPLADRCSVCEKKIAGKHRSLIQEEAIMGIFGVDNMHNECLRKRYGYMPDFDVLPKVNSIIKDKIWDARAVREALRQSKKIVEEEVDMFDLGI